MDELIRTAASQWIEKQSILHGEILPRGLLEEGFDFQGQRITLMGPQGIWKPKVMQLPISITTVVDGPYDDSYTKDGLILYRYRGEDPNHRDNIGLREVMRKGLPLIYFFGVVKGKYLAEWPAYIVYDSPASLMFTVVVDEKSSILKHRQYSEDDLIVAEGESVNIRRYMTRRALVRLHQGEFRIRVLSAYKEQCTFCRIRHTQLLDAAHIIPDNEGGEPVVPNGLALCKIHHAAFDTNIVGVNPDYKIIVREDVLEEIDGPMLKYGIQEMHNQNLFLPHRKVDWPDRDRLEERFIRFKTAV